MKSAVLALALASVSFFGLGHGAQAICTEGAHQPGTGAIDPYAPVSDLPYYPTSPTTRKVNPAAGAVPNVAVTATPAARITVVDTSLPERRPATASVPTVRLTVVNESSSKVLKPGAEDIAKVLESLEPAADKLAGGTPTAKEEAEPLDPALKNLVGTWMAVARRGDGELTTVELQLDDRGWAKFTVPGADGKPSTMKRRLELEDQELKLSGPDAELTLGKLIDVNSRQMVLARADGQITFVRP